LRDCKKIKRSEKHPKIQSNTKPNEAAEKGRESLRGLQEKVKAKKAPGKGLDRRTEDYCRRDHHQHTGLRIEVEKNGLYAPKKKLLSGGEMVGEPAKASARPR